MAEQQQQQFDWSNDSQECVEGLKFDHDTEYTFVLDNFTKHDMHRKNGELITFKKGDKEGEAILMYTFEWKETQTNVKFKDDYFVQDSYRVNENSPELEDALVKTSRKLGYSPVLGGRFSVADFVHIGMGIQAKLKYRVPTKAGETLDEARGVIIGADGKETKAYDTIDVETIALDGETTAADTQQELAAIDPKIVAELNGMIASVPKCKKFSDLSGKIIKLCAKDQVRLKSLMEPAMQLNGQGKLKF